MNPSWNKFHPYSKGDPFDSLGIIMIQIHNNEPNYAIRVKV